MSKYIEHESWDKDPFWGGFAKFVSKNFNKKSILTLAEELGNANRFQRGTESIYDLLMSRGSSGEALLRVIELYIKEFKGKNPNTDFDIYANGSAGHLQTFSEVITPLLRKRWFR